MRRRTFRDSKGSTSLLPIFHGINTMIGLQHPQMTRMKSNAALAATLAAIIVGAGVNVLPMLQADTLIRTLHWPEATLFAGISIGMLLSALAAPLGAFAIARFGLRHALAGFLAVLLLSIAISLFAQSAIQLSMIWAISYVAAGCLNPMVVGAIVSSKCYLQHCAATSSVVSSSSLAGPTLVFLIYSMFAGDGDRPGVIFAACCILAIAIVGIVILVPRHLPQGQQDLRVGAAQTPVRAVVNEPVFWILAFLTLVCGITSSGLIDNHLISLCRSQGLPATAGAGALVAAGVAALLGGLVFGIIADRFDGFWLLAGYYLARAVLLYWLPRTSLSFEELAQFGVLYGLDWAATMPVLFRIGLRGFGTQRIGAVMSVLALVHHAGGSATTLAVGSLGPQSYMISFTAGSLLCVVAASVLAAMSQIIGRNKPKTSLIQILGGTPVKAN